MAMLRFCLLVPTNDMTDSHANVKYLLNAGLHALCECMVYIIISSDQALILILLALAPIPSVIVEKRSASFKLCRISYISMPNPLFLG